MTTFVPSDDTRPQNASLSASKRGKPSDRLNPKVISSFGKGGKDDKSVFANIYQSGEIPCRLHHGSVKHKLMWSIPVETVSFDPVLVYLAEGLREKVHPYYFVARVGFKELLQTPASGTKALPMLNRIVPSLRAALLETDAEVFEAGCDSLVQLTRVVGPPFVPHLKSLMGAISKKSFDRKHRDKVTDTLQSVESNCGKDALVIIKSKVPTYCSVLR